MTEPGGANTPGRKQARERRAFARVSLDAEHSLVLYQADLAQHTAIGNLSEGGCFLPVSLQFEVGERCRLTLTVGEGLQEQRLSFDGVIVRTDLEGVGIRFLDLSDGQRQSVQGILAQYGGEER